MRANRVGRVALALGHSVGQPPTQYWRGFPGQGVAGGTHPTAALSRVSSEWRQRSRLIRSRRFDRHAFVNIAHADGKLYRAKFNGFVAGVFDFFPADVAAPPVNLNAGLILTDERIFDERRECAVARSEERRVGKECA